MNISPLTAFKIYRRADDILVFAMTPATAQRKLRELLAKTYRQAEREALTDALRAIESLPGKPDSAEIERALGRLEARLGQPLAAALEQPVLDLATPFYKTGLLEAGQAAGVDIAFGLTDLDALSVIGKQNLFWVGDHWDNDLKQGFDTALRANYEKGYSRRELINALEDNVFGIATSPEQMEHLDLMADHISAKTRELGRIEGYVRSGVEEIRVRSERSESTCAFCLDMDGRIISVRALAEQRDSILAAKSVDGLKAAQSWHSKPLGVRTKDLPAGVAGPPYHGRCYCTTIPVIREIEEPVSPEWGEDVAAEDRKLLDQYSSREWGYKIQGLRERAREEALIYNERDFKQDLTKHGGPLGRDGDRYHRTAQRTVATGNRVLAQVYRSGRKNAVPRIQMAFYSRETGHMAVTQGYSIKGCFEHPRGIRKAFDRHMQEALCLEK
ncbi:MAG: hypothetical protein P9M14_07620 [Candidatus Alcyoniella australis]|nr:hypothetical protein [Candidatus Alcyoniella australis]